MKIPINQIIPDPNQPRKTFPKETLQELRDSYNSLGLIQPITVRPHKGKYMIVVGERRYRAALTDGLKDIECIVREDIDDKKAREMQFAENTEQENIPPLELGKAFLEHRKKYGMSLEQLSQVVGLSRAQINRFEAIHTKLPQVIQAEIKGGRLDARTAYEISLVKDKKTQEELAKEAVDKDLGFHTVTKVSSIVREQPDRPVKSAILEAQYGEQVAKRPVRLEPTPTELTGDALILMMDYQRLENNLSRISPNVREIPDHAKKALYLKGQEAIQEIQRFNNNIASIAKNLLTEGKNEHK